MTSVCMLEMYPPKDAIIVPPTIAIATISLFA